MATPCMKCHSLFSCKYKKNILRTSREFHEKSKPIFLGEIKKNIINLSSAELAQRDGNVNTSPAEPVYAPVGGAS